MGSLPGHCSGSLEAGCSHPRESQLCFDFLPLTDSGQHGGEMSFWMMDAQAHGRWIVKGTAGLRSCLKALMMVELTERAKRRG